MAHFKNCVRTTVKWYDPQGDGGVRNEVFYLLKYDRLSNLFWPIITHYDVFITTSANVGVLFRDSKKGKIGSVIFFHLLLVRLAASSASAWSSSYSWVRFGSNQVSILHLEGIPPGVIYNWCHSCGSLRQVSQWKVAWRFNIQVLDVWSNIFQSLIRTWNHFWLSIQWPLADSTLALFSLQPCLESFDKTFWGLTQKRFLYP